MIRAKTAGLAKEEARPDPVPADRRRTAAHGMPDPRGQERFFHLDALRAALMFWGILVHASTVAPGAIFRGIAAISGLVRMEAFFVISGFLAYMLLERYGAGPMVKRRLLAIGLPLVTALLLLNPLTNYLIYCYHNPPLAFPAFLAGEGRAGARGPMNWHLHLWFLVALLVYSLLAPALGKLVDQSAGRLRRGNALGPEARFLLMAGAVVCACMAARVVFEILKPGIPPGLRYVVRSTGNFLPFYALGMFLFASPGLRAVFSRVHWIQTILACSLLALIHRVGGSEPGRLAEVAILASQTYVAVCLSSFLFWLAGRWVRGESRVARELSGAAYSVYLFHFLALYLFAFLFRPFLPDGPLLLVVISAATFIATLALHRAVILRVPLLELLFNGKSPRRR